MAKRDHHCAGTRERLASSPVLFALVHELGVHPQRDVVQEHAAVHSADVDPALGSPERVERGDRVVAIEAEIPREVVAGPERDADEREAPLHSDGGHGRQRAVAPGHPERVGLGSPGDLLKVLSVAEEVHVDPSAAGRVSELVGRRAVAAGAWINDQESGHGRGRV